MSLSTRGGEILIEPQKWFGVTFDSRKKIGNPYKEKCYKVQWFLQIGQRKVISELYWVKEGVGDQGTYYNFFVIIKLFQNFSTWWGDSLPHGLPHSSLFSKTALVNCFPIGVWIGRKTLELLNLILKGPSSHIIIHRCLYVIIYSHREGMINVNENHDIILPCLLAHFQNIIKSTCHCQ